MYTGVFIVVGGLSKAHAATHEYSWSSSTRFAWSLGYVALLCVAAYSVGLPEQPRTRRGRRGLGFGRRRGRCHGDVSRAAVRRRCAVAEVRGARERP